MVGISDGDGAIGRGSGRADGDVGGDAALAGTRVLRSLASCSGKPDSIRGGSVQAALRAADGRAVPAAGTVFPHADFEGIDSERGIAWRCADSFSLRDFLRLSNVERVPDHSWLSRTRSRLPHEAREMVFGWVLKLVAERGLVKGERIGVDGSTMEANAALRTIVRRDTGESYRAML